MEATDGSAQCLPTLVKRDPVTKRVVEKAVTNEEKTEMLRKEFFPPKSAVAVVPPGAVYPAPAWDWQPVSDSIIRRAIGRMKPYKATYPGSIPNCVFLYNTNLLVPFLGPIYRSLDAHKHYPQGWSDVLTLVLRKPGKPDYTDPSAQRPIPLAKGLSKLWNSCKTI
ncbi:hypothetical protein C8R43DRAFT_893170 [Mycena crocata]|nr:hypothetical protein C8R43DRAFT_893170 [Mycena crocata]